MDAVDVVASYAGYHPYGRVASSVADPYTVHLHTDPDHSYNRHQVDAAPV